MGKVVYTSNGGTVGNGIRITRVSEDGQKLYTERPEGEWCPGALTFKGAP